DQCARHDIVAAAGPERDCPFERFFRIALCCRAAGRGKPHEAGHRKAAGPRTVAGIAVKSSHSFLPGTVTIMFWFDRVAGCVAVHVPPMVAVFSSADSRSWAFTIASGGRLRVLAAAA